MPDEPAVLENWIEGTRLVLPSGWMEKQVLAYNLALRKYGLAEIQIDYIRERTSWLNRTIFFKLRGNRHTLEIFQKAIGKLAQPW